MHVNYYNITEGKIMCPFNKNVCPCKQQNPCEQSSQNQL